jgi:hypothetical protein
MGKTLCRGIEKLSILYLRDGGFGRRVSTSSGPTSGISSVVRSLLANVSGSSVRRPGNSVVDSRADPIRSAISLCLKCERDEVSMFDDVDAASRAPASLPQNMRSRRCTSTQLVRDKA